MIAIIDYGMGNLGSVAKAFAALGAETKVTRAPADLRGARKIVLPGVGSFGNAMFGLKRLKLIKALLDGIKDGKPYLGLCLGMQVLFEESREGGRRKGLGILQGSIVSFKKSRGLKVPHMGWNRIKRTRGKIECPLLKGVPDRAWMYFVHSYYPAPRDKAIIAASTDYGIDFASMVWKDNIYATQFHPEKSQGWGLKILENFVKLRIQYAGNTRD